MNAATLAPSPAQREAERHRPDRTVVLRQRWENLLFLHWQWDPAEVQTTLPAGLTVDTWGGHAWLAVAPLFMRNVHPRFVPAAAALTDFLELNVRTYVFDATGRPGVFFYTLACDQPAVVTVARRLLALPYRHARLEGRVDRDGVVDFALTPMEDGRLPVRYRYQGLGLPTLADPDALEFFLLERYRVFTADANGVANRSIQVAHRPFRYREALVHDWDGLPLAALGFGTGSPRFDHACVVDPVDIDTFTPEALG